MRIRHWLTELQQGCFRMVRRMGRKRPSLRRRMVGTWSATMAAQVECLEPRVVLSAPHPFQLGNLLPANGGNGSAGFAFNGAASLDFSGGSVASAGDVNGDGLDDLLIGAYNADPSTGSEAGITYLVFGTVEGSFASLNLSTLNGTNGFMFNGVAVGDNSGFSVSGAGDVNGDGFADILIGARFADPNGLAQSGQSYLVFGGQSNLSTLDATGGPADGRINLSVLNGTTGFTLNGLATTDNSGWSVSGAGDVNGDGFSDLMVGAWGSNAYGSDAGQGYLVFGGQANLAALDAADGTVNARINFSLLNGTSGFIFNGILSGDRAGWSVAGAGDVNGDGFGDLAIGAIFAAGADSGESYLVFGGQSNLGTLDGASGANGRIALSALNGSTGYIFNGLAGGDHAGYSISSAGDVNGDGFADILIGAERADPNGTNSGQSYIVFGGAANLSSLDAADGIVNGRIYLSNLNGTRGFILNGRAASDYSALSVSGAGDVNGDGFDDLLIGAMFSDPNGSNSGQSYVVFGGQSNLAALDAGDGSTNGRINPSLLNGTNGFWLNGRVTNDYAGRSVSRAGDVNGDGFADLLIGATGADPNGGNSGQSYVVFGGNFTNSATQVGTPNADTLTGSAAVDVIIGGRGNDTLIGNGAADVLYGGAGDDVLAISNTSFARIDGGNGSDTLRLDGSGMTLDLTAIADSRLTNIEAIDMRGSASNFLIVRQRQVLNMTQPTNSAATSNTLIVYRDNDGVNFGPGWGASVNEVIGGLTFQVWTQGAAKLKVQVFNQLPVFTSTSTPSVAENTTAVLTVTATDPDVPAQTITFMKTGGADQALFTLTSGGVLTFNAPPDFENPADADADNVYLVQVTASDGVGGTAVQDLAVTVTNVNESPLAIAPISLTTDEDTPLVVNGLSVADVDAGAGQLQLTLSVTHGGLVVRKGSGGLSSGGSVTVTGMLSELNNILTYVANWTGVTYVPHPNYSGPDNLVVTINDQGNSGPGGPLSDTEQVPINVLAVNDAPTLALQNVTATLAENTSTAASIPVANIVITDDALGTNALFLSGPDAAFFEIAGNSLRLKAGTVLDYENQFSYSLVVNVDDAPVGSTPDASVGYSLTITDVNEAPTAVALQNVTSTLVENTNTASAIPVADVVVTDGALGTNDLSLSGPDAAFFEIVGTTLRVKAGTVLDFEALASYAVTVNVDDATVGGTPDAFVSYSLTVTNVNEAPLAIVPASLTTDEDTPTVIHGLSVADVDAGTGQLQMTLSVTHGGLVVRKGAAGLASGGSITVTGTVAELNNILTHVAGWTGVTYVPHPNYFGADALVVTINDQGNSGPGGPLSDMKQVPINVLAVNDAPTLALQNVTTTLAENMSTVGAIPVANIVVTDDALGTNTRFLSGPDAPSFEIVGNTLWLKAGTVLDYETKPSYAVTVNVDDATVGSTPDASVGYSLTITDVNEAPTAVALQNVTSTLTENTSTVSSIPVAGIVVTDDALGTNALSLSGADAAFFEIVGTTLRLKAGTVLDYETQSSYSVTVNVGDVSVGSTPDASVGYTLTITDVNEAPTAVALQNVASTLAENTSTASAIPVADIVVTDDALGTNTLSLAGPDAAFFEIVGTTLRLKADTVLDYETKSNYAVTVNVDDATVGSSPDASVGYTLTITDENEAPTAVALQNVTLTLAENSNSASAIPVTDIVVTDDALGTNDLSLSGPDATFFEIVGSTLRLKADTVLDYETKSSYSVTVNVDDATVGGTPDASVGYTLTITDVNEIRVLLLAQTGNSTLSSTGNGSILVENGDIIAVASSSANAVVVGGYGNVVAGELDLASATGTKVNGNGQILAQIDHSVPTGELADPFASLASPVPSATPFAAVNYSGSAPLTLQPGTYADGIRISGDGNVTLLSGVYYLQGGGLSISGKGSVIGHGVMIYNAPQSADHTISLTGKGSLLLTAPTGGPYAGIAIFQSRSSTNLINVSGSGGINLQGALYAAGGTINLSGNGLLTLMGAQARLIASKLAVAGNGRLLVNGQGPSISALDLLFSTPGEWNSLFAGTSGS